MNDERGRFVDQSAEVFHLQDARERGIRAEAFYDRPLAGCAVLLHTGWDRHFGTPAYASGSRFTAVPPKVEGFGTFPVRAFARLG